MAAAAAVLALLACQPAARRDAVADPHLADLDQVATLTATTYANFEWALTEGGVNPRAVYAAAQRAIVAAATEEEARQALHGFVESFGDGHFRLLPARGPEPRGGAPASSPGPETPGGEACALLGYEEHDQSFRLDLGKGFRRITAPGDPFPAGWLGRWDGMRIGVVRIDEFGANRFGEYCPEVWESYRRRLDGPCDDWSCTYGFRLEVVDRLLDEIVLRIRALERQGIDALAVDITGNGGGSDWVDPAARLLTGRPLRGNERSVVRHPHWAGVFGEMAADVERDLARDDLGRAQRRLLEEVRGRLAAAIAEAREPCDLSAVWQMGAGELPCSILVRGKLFTTGLLAEPPAVDLGGLASAQGLFKALEYRRRPSAWRGPLALLIDRDTASASELFAALLRDNDAATLIGETTFGAGCGYTNGGIQTVLEHSRLEVWLPDCVRHRRDGGNERAGIAPDLPVTRVRGEPPRERGELFRVRLEEWVLRSG